MLYIFPKAEPRPSTLDTNKDEEYHLKFSRYCLSAANNPGYQRFLERARLNKRFYAGQQWTKDEDLEAFLKDDDGNERNRLKLIKNLIRPMVEQYRGNAIRMTINYKVKNFSPKAISRREQILGKLLWITDLANSTSFGKILKEKYPIGDDKKETEMFFAEMYVDSFEQTMNDLVEFVEHYNDFPDKQISFAFDMALNGIAVAEDFEFGGHQIFEHLPAENYYFDRSGKKPDLSDAAYMGKIAYMLPEDIYERWPVADYQRKAISNYAIQWANYLTTTENRSVGSDTVQLSGRVPVYFNYWKDVDKYEFGYVKDKYGYPMFTRINYTFPGEEKPRYTDADLIEIDSERSRKYLKGNKKASLYMETIRRCVLVPREVLSYDKDVKSDDRKDIVLEYGINPYQETEVMDYYSVRFPFKTYCWSYVDGEVLSPIDDAIDPQRFINRVFSVAENQINNSGGSNSIIDGFFVEDEADVKMQMAKSKPVFVNGKGRGIQNIVQKYDNNISTGTSQLFNIMEFIKNSMQDVNGVNEALKGESTGSDQLVGVTQLMIQKGTLLQEPFYFAIVSIYKQMYQSILSRGKRIYADNERELVIAAGDKGLKIVRVTKDMKLEDFRLTITRQNSDDMLIDAGNNILLAFLQMGIIDQDKYADLYNRSTPDQIAAAIRRTAAEKRIAATIQAKRDQEAQVQAQNTMVDMQQMQQQQAIQAQADMEKQETRGRKQKVQEVYAKGLNDLAKNGQISPGQFKQEYTQLQNQ